MDSPWLLQYNQSLFCIPLKIISKNNTDSIHTPSHLQSAIVLFHNKNQANHFKNNHLIKVLNNKTYRYNTHKDLLNESVVDFKLHINNKTNTFDDDINKIHILKNNSIIDDENLTAIELNDIDNDTIIMYSVFVHAIFLYINDIQINKDILVLDVIALNPFKIDIDRNDKVLNDTQMKTNIILEHLEKLYNKSESI